MEVSLNPDLKLAWCSHEAAKFAVMNWHYSKAMPSGKLVKIGVWENGQFIGCVLFGWGANKNIGSPFGLKQTEVCELVRVALGKHITPVTRIVSIAIKMLHRQSPGLKLIVSYADLRKGHTGIIYKAGNWISCGETPCQQMYIDGKKIHKRTASCRYGSSARIPGEHHFEKEPGKNKFIYVLDMVLRKSLHEKFMRS